MVFKEQIINDYLEHKYNLSVKSIYQIDNKNIGIIDINCDCEIAYFVDVESTPSYNRFNMRQMLNVVKLDFSDLLKYVRIKKLQNLN